MDLIRSQYTISDDEEDEEESPSEPSPPPPANTNTRLINIDGGHGSCLDQDISLLAPKVTATATINDEESDIDANTTPTVAGPDVCADDPTNTIANITEDDATEIEFIAVSKCSIPVGESFLHAQIKLEPFSESECESETTHVSDSESLDSAEISDHDDEKIKAKKRKPPKAKGELNLQDLPPIEDLHISVPHEECQAIGYIKSIVDTLVVVEAYPLTPAMDIDSVLFLAEGDKTLGHIFDVFGPVRHPHYCVRFNSKDHMDARGARVGELVYCAPKTPHTSYVLVARLERLKGTDSSWKDDHETPIDELEYSDDEAEMAARKPNDGSESVIPSRGRGFRKRINPRKSRLPHPSNAYQYNYGPPSPQQQSPSQYVPLHVAGFAPPRRPPYFHFGQHSGGRGRGYHRGRGFQHQYQPRPLAPPMHESYSPHYSAPSYSYNPPPPPPPHRPAQSYPHPRIQFQYPQPPPPPMPRL